MLSENINPSLDPNILRLLRTSWQNGLKFISLILSIKSGPNLKTLKSSKLSGIPHHFTGSAHRLAV